MKKLLALVLAALMLLAVLAGCAEKQAEQIQAPQTEEAQTEQPEQAEEPAVEESPVEEPEELPAEEPAAEPALEDGVYTAEFNTDSSMFHANEACDGKGTLTVENGEMTFHVSLASKKIVNLYPGKAAGYTAVILRPLMVVAGDHANNDMAGSDDDSWKTMFEAAGLTVGCQINGLGEIADVQALYVAHTKAAMEALNA